jgi:DNA topoisomerase-1
MGRYTFIITEKPDAAKRIAYALDSESRPTQKYSNRMPYYTVRRGGEIVVVPALGHLYTVAAQRKGVDHYPEFDYAWMPRYAVEKKAAGTRAWIEAITRLAENADTFIDACDYDIEGSLIGYTILRYACGGKENIAKRMKYSTLTKEELEDSYGQLLPQLDFGLIEAGLTRHEVDWLYGINLTRALTAAAKDRLHRYITLSTGRVQGPALKFVTTREKAIRTFVPIPYWRVTAHLDIDGQAFEAEYEKPIIETKREALAAVEACKGKDATVKTARAKKFPQPPPVPFDLGTLQAEAYRLFRYNPRHTSSIAQRLYLDALISYPRTSSQKLPPSIDYRAILKKLGNMPKYAKHASELLTRPRLDPREGAKQDPAHPAIHPTENAPENRLSLTHANILDLIVKRFMAVFGEPATKLSIHAAININQHLFNLKGIRTLEEGWMMLYEPYVHSQETILPEITEGQMVKVRDVILEDKFTQPPPRYNPSSLLRRMEKQEIGTKATRAETIQTLYNRKYIQNERMAPTDLGFEVAEVLEAYCPAVVSVTLTRELEQKMSKIQTGTGKKENVVEEAASILRTVMLELKQNEQAIGERFGEAIAKAQKERNTIATCPICREGKLTVIYSRKTGKRFVGCTNYFEHRCSASAPIPQQGEITATRRTCLTCGWPVVRVVRRGRRSWQMCLNPECSSKKRRI